ncbi:MAG TPA: hypothetical protein DIT46_04255 [Gemmatimonadetes bacterium]|nr:hypothetical protein [Gemmatimonadota bacterium]
MRTDAPDPIAIDVGEVLQRSVTSLYSSLITRPTGRAVRMAIETQLRGAGTLSVSLIDFSEVGIIDYSCADEVVAKLLKQYLADERRDALFVFRGVREPHRLQVEGVLQRQKLAAVVETAPSQFLLVGTFSDQERKVWDRLEAKGAINADAVSQIAPDRSGVMALESLVERGLVFRSSESGRVYALSQLVAHLI